MFCFASAALEELTHAASGRRKRESQGDDVSPVPDDSSRLIHRHQFTVPKAFIQKLCRIGNPQHRTFIAELAKRAQADYISGKPCLNHLPIILGFNVYQALLHNAAALGFKDEWLENEATSPFCRSGPGLGILYAEQSNYPVSLSPSTMQATVPHHPWIDLFPMQRMRDNLIKASSGPDCIDEDELCFDICDIDEGDRTDKASLIVWGEPSDPRSWEATVPFVRKWGFLLEGCTEVMQSTNRWRQERGERPLRFS